MAVGMSLLATGLAIGPLALDGQAGAEGGGTGTAIAVVSVVSIVGGYLLLAALWRYVFSDRAKARRREPD